jgi:hypothetical protein
MTRAKGVSVAGQVARCQTAMPSRLATEGLQVCKGATIICSAERLLEENRRPSVNEQGEVDHVTRSSFGSLGYISLRLHDRQAE